MSRSTFPAAALSLVVLSVFTLLPAAATAEVVKKKFPARPPGSSGACSSLPRCCSSIPAS
jgi:hypothetical protein